MCCAYVTILHGSEVSGLVQMLITL